MLVQTTVVAGEAVSGATVTAEVVRPALNPVALKLFDDGQAIHGDLRAEDGIYSNFFSDYAGDGSYVFKIKVDGQNSYSTAYVEEGGTFTPEAVDRFLRKTQVTTVLSGAPPTVYYGVYLPLVTRQFTTVSGFNSQFNGSAEGWEPHSGAWYVDSNYYYTYGLVDSSASASYAADYADFDYEVRMWRGGCDSCANRIYLRGTVYPMSSTNYWYQYYGFQYTRNGAFSVWKRVGGVAYELHPWTASSAINQGDAWNTLRVVASGSNLYFYINGSLVWAGSDYSLPAGRAGLGMYRDATSSGDLLRVDWATLSTLTASQLDALSSATVSAEQQALNEAALKQRVGDENVAPPAGP